MNSTDQNLMNNNVQSKVNESQFSFNADQQSFPTNNHPSFKIQPKSSFENNETSNGFMGQE
jgi:hypothetical protein